MICRYNNHIDMSFRKFLLTFHGQFCWRIVMTCKIIFFAEKQIKRCSTNSCIRNMIHFLIEKEVARENASEDRYIVSNFDMYIWCINCIDALIFVEFIISIWVNIHKTWFYCTKLIKGAKSIQRSIKIFKIAN